MNANLPCVFVHVRTCVCMCSENTLYSNTISVHVFAREMIKNNIFLLRVYYRLCWGWVGWAFPRPHCLHSTPASVFLCSVLLVVARYLFVLCFLVAAHCWFICVAVAILCYRCLFCSFVVLHSSPLVAAEVAQFD